MLRAFARVRGAYPSLYFVVRFVFGQCLGLWSAGFAPEIARSYAIPLAISLLLFTIVELLIVVPCRRFYLLSLLSGIASVWLHLPPVLQKSLIDSQPIIGQVVGTVTHPIPGLLMVPLKVTSTIHGGEVRLLPQAATLWCKGIDLPWQNASLLEQGSLVAARLSIFPLLPTQNIFGYGATLLRKGYQGRCRILASSRPLDSERPIMMRAREYLRAAVYRILGNNERAGLVLSMSIGGRDMLSRQTEVAFQRSGLAHLLVVSGYQVCLVYYLLRRLFFILLSTIPLVFNHGLVPIFAALGALIPALLFVSICGLEASSVRASLAIIIFVVSSLTERGRGMFHHVMVSLLFLSVLWPGCIVDPSVELTYAALSGICLGKGAGNALQTYLRVAFFATLLPSIVALAWFGQFSFAGFLMNPLLATTAGMVGCNGGLLAIAAAASGLDRNGLLLVMQSYLLSHFRALVLVVSEWPWACVELEGGRRAAVCFVLGGAVLLYVRRRLKQVVTADSVFR